MFDSGLTSYSLPLCSQPMMFPYDVPVPQPYPSPVPVPQPYVQNFLQPYDVPVTNTIQPVIVPTPVSVPVPQPVPIPIDRPYAVPVPQPVAVPVDRPYAVPFPVHVPVPQPVAVPQPYVVQEQIPVPVPYPVAVPVQAPQQQYYAPPSYRQVEYITEEPVRIIRRRRRRRPCRSYSSTPAPLPPIVIPISIQAPAATPQQPRPYQVIEYVQDIYPPAQVFTEQVPVGYVVKNTVIQQPDVVEDQQTSFNCQPGIILPSTRYVPSSTRVQQHIVQQVPTGQIVRRPLSVGGGGVQNVILQQPSVSASHSTLFSSPSFCTQFIS